MNILKVARFRHHVKTPSIYFSYICVTNIRLSFLSLHTKSAIMNAPGGLLRRYLASMLGWNRRPVFRQSDHGIDVHQTVTEVMADCRGRGNKSDQ